MFDPQLKDHIARELASIRSAGLYKIERVLNTPQRARIDTTARTNVLNMCANNYLGLADQSSHRRSRPQGAWIAGATAWPPSASSAARSSSTSSSKRPSPRFLGTEDTILYSSCWDANGGLFETILGEEDAVISDELNHASIIDGIRLCKAQRYRYKNNDMADLEAKLNEAAAARFKLIATDGVFSMDGIIANLPAICDLADKYEALVMVDDSHATGFMGTQRPRHPRVSRCDGPHRHPHRHARQGPRRRHRRLHLRPQRDRRDASPALAALSLLQLGRPARGRRVAQAPSNCSANRPNCATAWKPTPASSATA